MKITYNEKEKTVEIKDGLKKQYQIIDLTLIANLLNFFLFSVYILKTKYLRPIIFFWIILGLASLIILIYRKLKIVSSEKIRVSEISSLTEKEVFGRKRFRLKLKNGKYRELLWLKNKSDITQTKELFRDLGVNIV